MNGTKPTETELSSVDLCPILEASAKAGVTELKFRGLHVVFGRTAEQVVTMDPRFGLPAYPFVQQPPAAKTEMDLSAEQHKLIRKQYLENAETNLREDQLAELLVTNPQLYEELLQKGELENAVDGSDEDTE